MINFLSHILSMQLGIQNVVISQQETRLKDGTHALEGELELTYDKINKFIILVINAVQGDKVVSVHLNCVKSRYDEAMKKELREISNSLSFEK